MPALPKLIFRGDADPNGRRKLREVFPGSAYGGLLTNLSNHGQGLEIFSQDFQDIVNRHISIGWNKTHFLSFSCSRDRAIYFAGGESKLRLKPSDSDNFDSAIFVLNTEKFTDVRLISPGVFLCSYPSKSVTGAQNLPIGNSILRALSAFKNPASTSTLLLIDATTYLKQEASSNKMYFLSALKNAQRDEEWLALPLDLCEGVPGEFSALLDDGCLDHQFERFRYAYPEDEPPCPIHLS